MREGPEVTRRCKGCIYLKVTLKDVGYHSLVRYSKVAYCEKKKLSISNDWIDILETPNWCPFIK